MPDVRAIAVLGPALKKQPGLAIKHRCRYNYGNFRPPLEG